MQIYLNLLMQGQFWEIMYVLLDANRVWVVTKSLIERGLDVFADVLFQLHLNHPLSRNHNFQCVPPPETIPDWKKLNYNDNSIYEYEMKVLLFHG